VGGVDAKHATTPKPAASGEQLTAEQRRARRHRRKQMCRAMKKKQCRRGRKGRKCREHRRNVLAKCAVWKAHWQAWKAAHPSAAPTGRKHHKKCRKGKKGRRCRERRRARALARQTELAAAPPPPPTTATQTPTASTPVAAPTGPTGAASF